MEKRGQMQLSFGMIFSIILIIIFLVFSFFAIKKFLSLQDGIKLGQFKDDLQGDIDKLWKGTQGSQEVSYFLPSKIKFVCFANYLSTERGTNKEKFNEMSQLFFETENLFFYPVGSAEGLDSATMKHLNIEEITAAENPLCISNTNGKVKMTLEKSYGETLVKIKK